MRRERIRNKGGIQRERRAIERRRKAARARIVIARAPLTCLVTSTLERGRGKLCRVGCVKVSVRGQTCPAQGTSESLGSSVYPARWRVRKRYVRGAVFATDRARPDLGSRIAEERMCEPVFAERIAISRSVPDLPALRGEFPLHRARSIRVAADPRLVAGSLCLETTTHTTRLRPRHFLHHLSSHPLALSAP